MDGGGAVKIPEVVEEVSRERGGWWSQLSAWWVSLFLPMFEFRVGRPGSQSLSSPSPRLGSFMWF
eukprot:10470588-Heterocapsa_arctica.AAC.1